MDKMIAHKPYFKAGRGSVARGGTAVQVNISGGKVLRYVPLLSKTIQTHSPGPDVATHPAVKVGQQPT